MVALASPPATLATTELLGLLTACPWTQTNPPDCCMHEVRKLPLAELYAMIRHARAEDVAEFAKTCSGCTHRCPERYRW